MIFRYGLLVNSPDVTLHIFDNRIPHW